MNQPESEARASFTIEGPCKPQVLAIVIDIGPSGEPKLTLFLSCQRDSRVLGNNPVPARFQGSRMIPRPVLSWTLERLGEFRFKNLDPIACAEFLP